MYLVFDTETTGLPSAFPQPDAVAMDRWPRLVQLAWQLHDAQGGLRSAGNHLVTPEGFDIAPEVEKIHGISTARAQAEGKALDTVLAAFKEALAEAKQLVGHNLMFDIKVLEAEYLRKKTPQDLSAYSASDTMYESIDHLAIPGGRDGGYKAPKLSELYERLFNEDMKGAHDAAYDVHATARSFFELLRLGICVPQAATSVKKIKYVPPPGMEIKVAPKKRIKHKPFAHLHTHTAFSLLPGTLSVQELLSCTRKHEMPAVALTDLGNMYGVFSFVQEAQRLGIKPLVGSEFFVRQGAKAVSHKKAAYTRQVLIARNKAGYYDLSRLSSRAHTGSTDPDHPNIDKDLLSAHCKDLIALSGNLQAELPSLILQQGEESAEKALGWYLEHFGKNFYLELLDHGRQEEKEVNKVLMRWAKKHSLRPVAANEVFYARPEDHDTHDMLLCIREGALKSTAIGTAPRERMGFTQREHDFKSQEEMYKRFAQVPEALDAIVEIIEKVENYSLEAKVLLPAFSAPEGVQDETAYLRQLAYEGAARRYAKVEEKITQRLDTELAVIATAGYAGYFLIVQEITAQARKMDIWVGPGRGSAAGSVVAYCVGITDVDPLHYGLLFERFLNPERISMPDVDIDFDDERRQVLIDWIVQRYGKEHVAQIITYGRMGARSSIRDCARVLEYPLKEADQLAKLVPSRLHYRLKQAYKDEPRLQAIRNGTDLAAKVLTHAERIEGMVRNPGVHACGLIIAPEKLENIIPLTLTKDSKLLVTQYDNLVVEKAGLLKMDILGLRTLSVFRTALQHIEASYGETVVLAELPLDDKQTYALFQRGQTNAVFQFESPGMQRYLRELKPDRFEDLIAMNALYRPGPMEYIPSFIARKHGREAIAYDLPEMEDILAETYGIAIYQEQVMRLSQKLAGFSMAMADTMRYAMGKVKPKLLDELKTAFLEGSRKRGHKKAIAEKIWQDWKAFASYAFNKAHATSYSLLAYWTAYLKARYPAAYMAAVLTHHRGSSDKLSFFIEECEQLGLQVIAPRLNEPQVHFYVPARSQIGMGFSAVKGIGTAAATSLVEEWKAHGAYRDIADLTRRCSLSKNSLESMAKIGVFDDLDHTHRRQYLEADQAKTPSLIDQALKGNSGSERGISRDQSALFGEDAALGMGLRLPELSPYTRDECLALEREVLGTSVSGHPLDPYRDIIKYFQHVQQVLSLSDEDYKRKGRSWKVLGVVTTFETRRTRKGNIYGHLALKDYSGAYTFQLWREALSKHEGWLKEGMCVYVKGAFPMKESFRGDLQCKIDSISELSAYIEGDVQALLLSFHPGELNEERLAALERMLLSEKEGACAISFRLQGHNGASPMVLRAQKCMICPSLSLFRDMAKESWLEMEIKSRK